MGGSDDPRVQKAMAALELALETEDEEKIAKASAALDKAERARDLTSQLKKIAKRKRGAGVQKCRGCGFLGGSWRRCPRNKEANRATMHTDGGAVVRQVS